MPLVRVGTPLVISDAELKQAYVNLKLFSINSIVLTGGITKVLSDTEIEDIISFFYKKILNSNHNPAVVLDKNYDIWTLGITSK